MNHWILNSKWKQNNIFTWRHQFCWPHTKSNSNKNKITNHDDNDDITSVILHRPQKYCYNLEVGKICFCNLGTLIIEVHEGSTPTFVRRDSEVLESSEGWKHPETSEIGTQYMKGPPNKKTTLVSTIPLFHDPSRMHNFQSFDKKKLIFSKPYAA